MSSTETTLAQASLPQRIQQKHEYSRVLLELSGRQQELVESQEYDALITLLQQKQAVLEALHHVSGGNLSLATTWQQQRSQLPEPVRQTCEKWLEQTESFLTAAMQIEQFCTDQMQERRDETQSQLAAVSGSLVVHDAYNDLPVSNYFDMNR